MERPTVVHFFLLTFLLWKTVTAEYSLGGAEATHATSRRQLKQRPGVYGMPNPGPGALFLPAGMCACSYFGCSNGMRCACHSKNGPTCVTEAEWRTIRAPVTQNPVTPTEEPRSTNAAAIDPKAISTFNDYLINGCSGSNTEYFKPRDLTDQQWSSLCGRLSGDHCILSTVKCSSAEVLFYDTKQPGKKVAVAKGIYSSGAVMLTTPTGKPLGPVINRKAASAFYSYIINGCASPANKQYPKPSSLSSSAWSGLCGNLSGEHCAPNGVKCGKDEVLFYDMSKLPDKKVVVAAGVYASGEIQIRN